MPHAGVAHEGQKKASGPLEPELGGWEFSRNKHNYISSYMKWNKYSKQILG